MEYQASSLAFSKKLSNGHDFSGNSIYDGVFAAPTKFSGPNFSSRVEDYREIFGGSEASRGSIPFLEVPELNERKISVDVRSSKLDYSNIFGGFEDSNFALPYQEFSRETNKRKKSEQARTPAQRFSPPEPAENYSCGNPVMEEEASHQVKTFNMSYNKINNGIANGANGTNGMTRMAHVHAVQSYACLIDEDDKAIFSEVNETFPKSNNVCEGKMEGNHFKRATTDVQAGETGKQTSSSDEFQNNSNWFKSHTMDKLFGKYEVGQETLRPKVQHSSSLPGKFNLDKAEGNFWTDTTGGSTGLHSPPYFDEEIDTNSVAATSAAALRKAIEEAEVRIKMAKELMERMKAGTRNGVKQSVNDGVKPKERKENEIAYKLNRSKKKKTTELCEEVDIPLHVSSRTREKSPVGQHFVTANFENREEVKLSNEVDQGTPRKEISSQAGLRQEKADVSEAEHFYEVENTGENWSTTIELDIPVSSEKRNQNVTGPGQVTEDFKVQEFVSSTTEAARETLWNCFKSSQGDHRKEKDEPIEAGEQFYEVESSDKNWATISECEDVKMVQSVDEDGLKEKKIAQEVFEKPQKFIEELKPAEEEDHPEIIKNTIERLNGISGVYDCGMGGGKSMLDVKVSDHEKIDWKEVTLEQEDNKELVQASNENDKCEKKPIEFLAPIEDNGEVGILGLEDVEHMNQSTTRAWVENDRRGEEAYKPEGHEKEQNDIHSVEDTERSFVNRADQGKIIEETLNKLHLGKQIAKILIHDSRSEENEKLGEAGGNDKILEGDASEKEENESRHEETCQRTGTERVETKIDLSPGDKEKVKAALEEPSNQENFLGAVDDVCKQHESDNLIKNEKPTLHAENADTVEVSQEVPACEESGSITEVSDAFLEANESVNELDSVKEKYDVEERDVLETDGIPQGLGLTKIVKPMEDKMENAFLDKKDTDNTGRADMNFVWNPNDQHGRQFEIVCSPRRHIEELASEMEKLNEDEESEVAVSQEDDESNTKCSDEQRWVDNEIDMKAARLSDTSEGEGENVELNEETRMSPSTEKEENHEEIPISESAEQNEKSYQETLPTQSVETNEENHKPTVSVEESETNDSLQKEVELEKEHLRKIDEAKEREREREKERIAVERAIREARERAFAEARERAAAERAAAGARQRATSEARERVGKTSAETNDKSAAEKVSKEAKLKAERERAAVERATAEARVRALEKAMSGKVASEARKQNSQHKGSFSSSSTRYSHSSNHGVPNNAERFDGTDVESVQRCKARSERHQRITERAEKALAEKNRRDLLAQKEQAERNRLAETLDVEVKRWSSGKEGNLRALLSTLQYILGPDSGWQPIPLTDLLTAAAAKKTYRKATLFVHPDKLQQRGASIQQKYTCEKVFDLLKEAWNRFNVEER